jgi:lysyl-tRNA synthetase class 1
MFWVDEVLAQVPSNTPQIINDSKTPSGRVHVGALRGVIIHDAIFRALRARGVEARYLYGVDDYDPVDEIPAGERVHVERYLGQPLCNVPPPAGSTAPDMAEHYIREFFDVFDKQLGVKPEIYRMRDVYRSGHFDEAIDRILKSSDAVRAVYKEVSGSSRDRSWHPFQVICEQCGRIGTTEVFAYEGGEVVYYCNPTLVKWARGCSYRGKVAPFNGKGKLP